MVHAVLIKPGIVLVFTVFDEKYNSMEVIEREYFKQDVYCHITLRQ